MGNADKFRFGYVEDPLPEHAQHRGKLAIPYLRKHPRHGWLCVDIRFRALDPETKPKYASLPGSHPRLYNTPALTTPATVVGITEGELDAVTATILGLPTVGVPGAANWREHWPELFRGYRRVVVFADGDDPGTKIANTIAKTLPNAQVIQLPDGEDLNSLYLTKGEDYVRSLWEQKEGHNE